MHRREEEARLLANTRGAHRFSDHEKAKMHAFQSLDFTVVDNQLLHEYNRRNTRVEYLVETAGKWIISFFIGLITGVAAYAIKTAVETLNEVKFEIAEHYIHDDWVASFAIYFLMNLVFALASCLVIFIVRTPLAGGSGIPEVKGYLNGVRIPDSLNVRTLIGKIASLILAFSSSMVLGPEGPMIHIGSMIGAAVGQVKSKSLKWYPKMFWRYHNDRDRRDFISSGAAAGVAAAFGAPIGGILFSIEEASSFWSPQLTWRTFFTCLTATYAVAALMNGLNVLVSNHGIFVFGLSNQYLYQAQEVVAFILLAVMGGIVGSTFIRFNVKLCHWRLIFVNRGWKKVVEVGIVSTVTSIALFGLPWLFECQPFPKPIFDDGCSDFVNATESLVGMFCAENQYSPLGSLMFNTPDAALRLLYSRDDQHLFPVSVLVLSFFVFFVLTVITGGLMVAGGLFIPQMLIGAILGKIFGHVMQQIFPFVDPSVYALIGTTAVMAGFTRMTIALVVIMVELTQGTQYLLPIILTVMVSKWVGEAVTEGQYEHLMDLKCIPYLDAVPPQSMLFLNITDVMKRNVVTIAQIERVSEIVHILRHTQHGGFPVVEKTPSGSLIMRGLILRSHLLVLLKSKNFIRGRVSEQNVQAVTSLLTYEEFTHEMARKLPDVDDIRLSHAELQMFLDIQPYMNASAIAVQDSYSYTEAYKLFRTMGLRHLVVVNKMNEVVGMVTRKDLL